LIPGLIPVIGLSPKNRDIFLESDFFNGELRPIFQGLSAVSRALNGELRLKFQGLSAVSRALNGELYLKFQGLNAVLRAKYWAIKVLELGGGSHIN
jgi:hypothetical protein